jgi:hypothetical protein
MILHKDLSWLFQKEKKLSVFPRESWREREWERERREREGVQVGGWEGGMEGGKEPQLVEGWKGGGMGSPWGLQVPP